MHLRTNSREREQCGTQTVIAPVRRRRLVGGSALVRLQYPLKTPVPPDAREHPELPAADRSHRRRARAVARLGHECRRGIAVRRASDEWLYLRLEVWLGCSLHPRQGRRSFYLSIFLQRHPSAWYACALARCSSPTVRACTDGGTSPYHDDGRPTAGDLSAVLPSVLYVGGTVPPAACHRSRPPRARGWTLSRTNDVPGMSLARLGRSRIWIRIPGEVLLGRSCETMVSDRLLPVLGDEVSHCTLARSAAQITG